MKKALSILGRLASCALEELRQFRSFLRKRFPLFFKAIPDESAEMDWDVEDPYEELMFKEIRSANAPK